MRRPIAFPELIKAARDRSGMSLSEAAKLIGCTKAHIWDLERGNSKNPTIKTLAGIACAYDIDLGSLATAAAAAEPGAAHRKTVAGYVKARAALKENGGSSTPADEARALIKEALDAAPADDPQRFIMMPDALAESGWFKRARQFVKAD